MSAAREREGSVEEALRHAKASIDIGQRIGFRTGTESQVNAYRALIHLEQRCARLEEALRFYADSQRYLGPNQLPSSDDPYTAKDAAYMQDTGRDMGEIARAALSAEGEQS